MPGSEGAPRPPSPHDDGAYCAQRFRSYDPGSGTYIGHDGIRRPWPQPFYRVSCRLCPSGTEAALRKSDIANLAQAAGLIRAA